MINFLPQTKYLKLTDIADIVNSIVAKYIKMEME